MKLVICEKPSVGAAVAAALGVTGRKDGYIEGNGYLISWCIGHLIQLSEAAAYGEQYKKWTYDSLPILPQEWQYTVAADKGKQFKILKDLMRRADVSEVVNACDAGREGELIFRFVYHQAGCKKPFTRLWISSMENEAIRSGFDNLKDGREYDALYHSALCRAKADWLIGINATRLFSYLYGKTLNVGRVQTPTLKMLVDRDAAIMNFKKEKYYHVRLMLPGAEAASAKICAADEASELKAACEASAAVCTSLTHEKKTVAPPKLFDLTSLQREANRIYGYTAKQTLDLAQTLYEKKLLIAHVPYAVIAALIGIVLVVVYEIDRTENHMIMDMPLINMGSQNILMLSFGYCVGKLPPDFMGFSVIDFPRLKGLYQMVG